MPEPDAHSDAELDARLEAFAAAGTDAHPPPVEGLRRRGDRLRTRRRAATVLVAAVAVLAVIVPLGLGGRGDHDARRPSPVAPTPSTRWRTDIPADFPLNAGRPDVAGDGADYETRTAFGGFALGATAGIRTCTGETWSPSDVVEHLVGSSGSAGFGDRFLFSFADSGAAHVAFRSLVPRRCPSQGHGHDDEIATWSLDAHQETITGAAAELNAVRVGNALGVSVDPPAARSAILVLAGQMCRFAAHPCAATPLLRRPTARDGWPASVPASIDLRTGRRDVGPVGGRIGAVISPCRVPELGNRSIVASRRANVAPFSSGGQEGRSLFLYPSGAAAAREVAALRRVLKACAADPIDPGETDRLSAPRLGDGSLLFTEYAPGTGAGATTAWYRVVRVGSALVWTASSASSSSRGDPEIAAVIDRQGRSLVSLLAQLRRIEPRRGSDSADRGGDPVHQHLLVTPSDAAPTAEQLPAVSSGAWDRADGVDLTPFDCPSGPRRTGYAGNDYLVDVLGGPSGDVRYTAVDQVATYDTAAQATAAKDYLVDHFCEPRRPGIVQEGTEGEIGSGSLDSAIFQYVYPDGQCPTCGRLRYESEMVAVVGRRLVLASVSQGGGDTTPPGWDTLRLAVLARFVKTAAAG